MIRTVGLALSAAALVALTWGAAADAQNARTRTIVTEQATSDDMVRSLVPVGVSEDAEVSIAALVTFKFDSADLTPTAQEFLDRMAVALVAPELEGYSFLLEGHTDASGSDAYNQSLSERRAASVYDYLAIRGVPITRLDAVGYGETRLLPDVAATDERNRRVEVVRQR